MKGKIAILKEIGKPLEIVEREVPEPQDGEVVLKVLRTNICGSDIHMITGEAFRAFGGLFFPIVPGHEFIGRIEKLGKGVNRDSIGNPISEGDIVSPVYFKSCGHCYACSRGRENVCLESLMSVLRNAEKPPYFVGSFSDFYVVRAGQKFYKLPNDIPIDITSAINCALSQVIFGLKEIGIEYGDSVAIQGAGGLGLLATAVAKDMGAEKVIVIDAIENRLSMAKEFGADEVIKLDGDFRERIAKVKDITGGGADVVIELAGNASAVREGVKYLKRGGKYLIMGAINPKQKFEADPSVWIGENISLKGVSLYLPHTITLAINFLRRKKNQIPFSKMFGKFEFENINEAVRSALDKIYPRVQIKFD